MNIIEALYKNSMQPSEKRMRVDKIYTQAKNQEKQYYEKLCERLSGEDLAILNKFAACHEKMTKRKNTHSFTSGFKTGLSVAVISLIELIQH